MAHLKGQNVNLYLSGIDGSSFAPLAASTNCSLDVTTNTADGASKSDAGGGIWDNPDPTNTTWTMSNESFVVSIPMLSTLLNHVITNDGDITAIFSHNNSYGNEFRKKGAGIIDNLSIEAANNDYAKLSLSISSNGALEDFNGSVPEIPANTLPKIKGKALMVAMKVQISPTEYAWRTLACSTSHKLTVAQNISDVTDKDCNDLTVLRSVTGKSVTLSTENLIEVINTASSPKGAGIRHLSDAQLQLKSVRLQFGYYPNSIGQSIHDKTGHESGWGDATNVLIEGDFIISSFNTSGQNKEDATFSAEFQNKGMVTVTTPSASAHSED